jgi:hypothetical protein
MQPPYRTGETAENICFGLSRVIRYFRMDNVNGKHTL